MNKSLDIIKVLKDQYFWDVDISELDLETSQRLIIERVFRLGDVTDMKTIIGYYGKKKVVDVLCKLNYLDPKTLNFVSKLFNKSPKNFQCYIRKQSDHQHWNS